MKQPNESFDALAQLIDRTLRDQPPMSAPRTLEARVLAEIERRAAREWWREGFVRWPVGLQVAFVLASLVVVKFVVEGVVGLIAAIKASSMMSMLQAPLDGVRVLVDVLLSFVEVIGDVISAFPSQWLYLGVFVGMAAYAALFGMSAAVYRTLYK